MTKAKVGIYTPFNLRLGGGELYILSTARALSEAGYEVSVFSSRTYSGLRVKQLERDFGVDFRLSHVDEISKARKFDAWIAMDNYFAPMQPPKADRFIYHSQFPFPADIFSLNQRIKNLRLVSAFVVNSRFTESSLRDALPDPFHRTATIEVINPPAVFQDRGNPREQSSRNLGDSIFIANVGRFGTGGHRKNQASLIEALFRLRQMGPEDFRLRLLGGATTHDDFLEINHLKKLATDLFGKADTPVEFAVNASQARKHEVLRESRFYWHATGLGVNSVSEPHKLEHFGISPLEAMHRRSIPFVYGFGGPGEYVSFGVNGFLFNSIESLATLTFAANSLPSQEINRIQEEAVKTAGHYSYQRFAASWESLIERQLAN
jgi:O-antigen biosynthesis protein